MQALYELDAWNSTINGLLKTRFCFQLGDRVLKYSVFAFGLGDSVKKVNTWLIPKSNAKLFSYRIISEQVYMLKCLLEGMAYSFMFSMLFEVKNYKVFHWDISFKKL